MACAKRRMSKASHFDQALAFALFRLALWLCPSLGFGFWLGRREGRNDFNTSILWISLARIWIHLGRRLAFCWIGLAFAIDFDPLGIDSLFGSEIVAHSSGALQTELVIVLLVTHCVSV